MADFRAGDHPDNDKLCVFCTEFCPETFQCFLIVNFLGERGIDQDDIVIFQCLHTDINNGFVFIISDILFKKVRTSVDLFAGDCKYTVR